MSNLKIVDNNASTTVAVQLLAGGTTLTVATGEGVLFSTIASPEIMNLTLDGANGVEIVQVTTHTAAADTFTIVRAQEGTTAVQYEIGETVELRLTKVYLDSLIQLDNGGDAKGTDSINIQPGRSSSDMVASGSDSIVIGRNSLASGTRGISIGYFSEAATADSVSIGFYAQATGINAITVGRAVSAVGLDSLAIGSSSISSSLNGISIGKSAITEGNNAISIGSNSECRREGSIAIGKDASIAFGSTADFSTAIGFESKNDVTNTTSISGPIIIRDNVLGGLTTAVDRVRHGSGAEVIISTGAVSGLFVTDTEINLPTNFFITEAGAVCSAVSGLTTQPTIAFGTTAILTDIVPSTITTALTAVNKIHRFTSPSLTDTGLTSSIFCRVITVATSTTFNLRFYVKGFFMAHS